MVWKKEQQVHRKQQSINCTVITSDSTPHAKLYYYNYFRTKKSGQMPQK